MLSPINRVALCIISGKEKFGLKKNHQYDLNYMITCPQCNAVYYAYGVEHKIIDPELRCSSCPCSTKANNYWFAPAKYFGFIVDMDTEAMLNNITKQMIKEFGKEAIEVPIKTLQQILNKW